MGKLGRIIRSAFRAPVRFEDNLRTEPIDNKFGFERGTPIDRYYIEKFLRENADVISGDLLEIAENTYSKRFGSNVSSYGVLTYDSSDKKATIIGDLTKQESLPENKIDCFICTQTLNFIYNVPEAIKGIYKLLKPNGVLLCTVSGISQISRYDMDRWGDFWRFTDKSIRLLAEEGFGEGNVETITYGNVLAAKSLLDGLALEDMPDKSLLDEMDKNYQLIIGIKAIKK